MLATGMGPDLEGTGNANLDNIPVQTQGPSPSSPGISVWSHHVFLLGAGILLDFTRDLPDGHNHCQHLHNITVNVYQAVIGLGYSKHTRMKTQLCVCVCVCVCV